MKKSNILLTVLLTVFILTGSGIAQSTIKMNEVFSRGTAEDPDWIEVYNASASAVDISGYKIYDSGGQSGSKPKKEFPAGTTVAAYGYYVIITDDSDASGFGISNSGEWVWLEDASGTVIDSFLVPALLAGQTAARTPDGSDLWKVVSTITRGKSNVVLTSILLPQYIQGLNGTNNNRTPYAFRVKIENLLPNTTYRYINQVVTSADGATTNGAGNVIFVYTDSLVRTSSPSLNNSGPYGIINTDADGAHTGWYITEPTGNARFTPGNYLSMRIRLNNGADGTAAVIWATTDSVKVINYGNAVDPNMGTGIYGYSFAQPKDFVFIYDNVDGSGRPIAGAMVQTDGIDVTSLTNIAQFYRDSVDNIDGAWGAIIPNQLANGIRRVERRLFADGSLFDSFATDDDGIWPSGANTVNPMGGLTPIKIDKLDAPIPVELTSFTASVINGNVTLTWTTATETNNKGFEVQRRESGEFTAIAFIEGNGTTVSVSNYSFVDSKVSGKVEYRLKQVDYDGSFSYSNVIEVETTVPTEFNLSQNYPNPFNPVTIISYQLPVDGFVTLKVYDILGNEVKTLVNENRIAGSYKVEFDGKGLTSGLYIYRLVTDNYSSIKKMMLLK